MRVRSDGKTMIVKVDDLDSVDYNIRSTQNKLQTDLINCKEYWADFNRKNHVTKLGSPDSLPIKEKLNEISLTKGKNIRMESNFFSGAIYLESFEKDGVGTSYSHTQDMADNRRVLITDDEIAILSKREQAGLFDIFPKKADVFFSIPILDLEYLIFRAMVKLDNEDKIRIDGVISRSCSIFQTAFHIPNDSDFNKRTASNQLETNESLVLSSWIGTIAPMPYTLLSRTIKSTASKEEREALIDKINSKKLLSGLFLRRKVSGNIPNTYGIIMPNNENEINHLISKFHQIGGISGSNKIENFANMPIVGGAYFGHHH